MSIGRGLKRRKRESVKDHIDFFGFDVDYHADALMVKRVNAADAWVLWKQWTDPVRW
jgi:hypothetical protein